MAIFSVIQDQIYFVQTVSQALEIFAFNLKCFLFELAGFLWSFVCCWLGLLLLPVLAWRGATKLRLRKRRLTKVGVLRDSHNLTLTFIFEWPLAPASDVTGELTLPF
jgi:hypothetical protein